MVKIPVAALMAAFPTSLWAIIVAREEEIILTRFFPIKMALNILDFCSMILSTRAAFLFPSSISERIFIVLTVVKAVSAEEKKPDRNSKSRRIISMVISDEAKFIIPFIWFLIVVYWYLSINTCLLRLAYWDFITVQNQAYWI